MPVRTRLISAALALAAAAVAAPFARAADIIIHNARIITLDTARPQASAIAIRGLRIHTVGGPETVNAFAKPGTRYIDARGRTVIPGLIDSHIHAIRAGLNFASQADFSDSKSIPQAMQKLAAAAKTVPANDWLLVLGGWTPQQFAEDRKPLAAEIEAAADGRKVFIQLFYRAVYLSPEAMKALAINPAALPAGLQAETGPDERPTGWLTGDAGAITALYERIPKPSLAAAMDGTRRFFSELNRFGVTGVIDPGGHNLAPDEYSALWEVWHARQLTLRVAFSICAPTPGRELEEYRQFTRFLPMGAGDEWLRFNGIGERVTWGFYNNENPSPQQTREFEEVARWAAQNRLTLTVHWNRQASVKHLLDVFGRVSKETPYGGLRWSIAHLHDATPDTLARMRALNLGWLTQNAFYYAGPAFIRNMAPSRLALAPPLASAIAMGLPTGAGTDATRVMSQNPLVAMQWMIDGKTVSGETTRGPGERLDRLAALRLWTQGSAWFAFAEDERGQLKPGMLADIAILDRDFMAIPVEEISQITAIMTIVGGKIVHNALQLK